MDDILIGKVTISANLRQIHFPKFRMACTFKNYVLLRDNNNNNNKKYPLIFVDFDTEVSH